LKALGVFATAPIPGRVKARLAVDVGPSTAAEVYWRVGRKVVAATVGSGYRTTVWFTPPTEASFVREWLDGLGRVELRPQVSGTLGARLAAAFASHFADGARRVVLTGSDSPGVDRRLVAEAFNALGAYDVVLGPAVDGGYYLIGLVAPQPALFRAIPWGTAAVLAQTRARIAESGMRLRLLKPLRDVDTARDARALGFLKP